ncbi:MAG: hypothetical protein A4E73_03910 [Syntrophaceae bacterium PtaU1.Bin231]|nr:MAG: hypothetical protein A4E73_03910 [Syntrophaceae bacterium PtaU1.Bin231]
MKKNFMANSICLVILVTAAPLLAADPQGGDLAKKVQNPVADLISVPFQSNFNFNYGPNNDTQFILNVQPVIPIHLNEEWNLVTRTIMPFIDQPLPEWTFGLGDINTTLFLSPARLVPVAEGGVFWGVGPILQFPTATDDILGSEKWAAGPAAVVGYLGKTWVLGGLVNNLWSYAGDSNRASVNVMTAQPFVNYNLPDAWYLSFSPIITAVWNADSDQVWTVPLGAAVGKIFKIGNLPFNGQLGAYYNVIRPDVTGPEWQIRFQIALLLPG